MAQATEGVGLPSIGPGMNKELPGRIEPVAGTRGEKAETGLDRYNRERRERRSRETAKKEQDERDAKILEVAQKEYKRAAEAEAQNRADALDDLKFKAGVQWPADIAVRRNTEKRPCLTINKIPTFTHQITNDIRQNRPGINISPLGNIATKESAEVVASIIRGIERDSAADIAYDTAIGSAVDIGFGYWRILTEYERSDSFNQVIVVRRIRNSFTVLLDPARQEPDGSDAGYGFISELMYRDEFKDKYPDADPVNWKDRTVGENYAAWVTKDQIRIAEYFKVVFDMRRLVQLENGHIGWYDDLSDPVREQIRSKKLEILNDRIAECQRVIWRKLTYTQVLESQPWPGKWIPIVEVLGDEIDLEGRVVRVGVIRNAKDPQRMKNYWATSKTERVALAPKAHHILAEGQDEGYEDEWKVAHTKAVPALHYVPVEGPHGQLVPIPQVLPPSQVDAGTVEAEKSAEQDMMATTGVRFDATTSERIYDESGKALKEIRRASDIGAFHYSDNFSRSQRHGGRIILDLVPKVMDTRRWLAAIAEDGNESRVYVDPTQGQPLTRRPGKDPAAEPDRVFNPNLGEYACTVTIGPSYATRRIEAKESMEKFIGQVPDPMKGVVAALIAKYSDWPGSSELFSAMAKLLPPGALAPDPKDLSPQVTSMITGLQKQIQQLVAERLQLVRDLAERKTDQALTKEKIDRDYAAKITKIIADCENRAMAIDAQWALKLLDVVRNMHQALTGAGQVTGQSVGPAGA